MDSKLKTAIILLAFAAGTAPAQVVLLHNNANFGDFPEGDVLTNHFFISNSSPSPVRINNVRPKCGCTVIQYQSNTLRPGQTSKVDFSFRSAGYNGPVSKGIMVSAGSNQMDYYFILNVIPNIAFEDTRNIMSTIHLGLVATNNHNPVEKDIVIDVRRPAADTHITEILCDPAKIQCTYDPKPVDGKIKIHVQIFTAHLFGTVNEPFTINIMHQGSIKSLRANVSAIVPR